MKGWYVTWHNMSGILSRTYPSTLSQSRFFAWVVYGKWAQEVVTWNDKPTEVVDNTCARIALLENIRGICERKWHDTILKIYDGKRRPWVGITDVWWRLAWDDFYEHNWHWRPWSRADVKGTRGTWEVKSHHDYTNIMNLFFLSLPIHNSIPVLGFIHAAITLHLVCYNRTYSNPPQCLNPMYNTYKSQYDNRCLRTYYENFNRQFPTVYCGMAKKNWASANLHTASPEEASLLDYS